MHHNIFKMTTLVKKTTLVPIEIVNNQFISRFITHKTKALKDTIKCCILVMLFLISFYPPTTLHHWFILIYFA